MNHFKRPMGTTRWTRLQAENESLTLARDRALEAAAKWRLVAENALVPLVTGQDLGECDAEAWIWIQGHLELADHLKEMRDTDPMSVIRLLLESMDSPELTYIRAAHEWNSVHGALQEEYHRLSAIHGIFKDSSDAAMRRFIPLAEAALGVIQWIMRDRDRPFTKLLIEKFRISEEQISTQVFKDIAAIFGGGKETPANDHENKAPEVPEMQQSAEG